MSPTAAGSPAPGRVPPWLPPLRLIAVVAGAGALGALCRHGVELLLPWQPTAWPWGIFLVNALGCLAIGVATGVLADASARRATVPPWWRPLVVTGFLGGFTTFSTYIVEVLTLLQAGEATAAVLGVVYLVGSVAVGVAAVWVGLVMSARVPWRTWSTDVDIG